jgi:deazaflavin-dependent oxidoreductase (nitroreductase family)
MAVSAGLLRWTSRTLEKLAASRLGARLFIQFWSPIDCWLLRVSKGRVGSAISRPVLLLTARGARTGRPRTVPLLYLADRDRLVLVASKGGSPRHPAWYLNLRAHPEATVEIRGRRSTYEAREAEGDERAALWRRAVDVHPGYDVYQSRAGRQIPVMVLTPKSPRPDRGGWNS